MRLGGHVKQNPPATALPKQSSGKGKKKTSRGKLWNVIFVIVISSNWSV